MLLILAASVRADEILLKDGSKIVGTIVDFEDQSFKVQTSYGFATVRKDSIAQISRLPYSIRIMLEAALRQLSSQ